MGALLSLFIGSFNKIYALLGGVGIVMYTYLIKRNAKLNVDNNLLNKEIGNLKDDADKIVTIQRKAAEIASTPPSSRHDLYNQLRQIAARRTKNKF